MKANGKVHTDSPDVSTPHELDGLTLPRGPLRAARDHALMTLIQLDLDPRRRALDAIESAAALAYPSDERQTQAARALGEFERAAAEHLSRWDITALKRAIYDLSDTCRRLAIPPPQATFPDSIAAHKSAFEQCGWCGGEIDALRYFAATSDQIANVSIDGATLASGRLITRVELREGSRPAFQDRAEWEQTPMYREMLRAHEAAKGREQSRAAAQVVRHSAGPRSIIGKPA
jgi:hypothetical protein